MANLLVKAGKPDAEGAIQRITPRSAGWRYVGFEVYALGPGARLTRETGDREVCLVPIIGRMRVIAGGRDFGSIIGRADVFKEVPTSVYVPAKSSFAVTAEGSLELAVCSAPALGRLPARLIGPDRVGHETRGAGTNTRYVRNLLPETEPAESLLVVEVITPGGHWSSYPPHKHDTDALPEESALEEIYYHRLAPETGFAVQRVYTADRSLDATLAVGHRDVVLIPRGYHPVGAPHGIDLYYLNVMAGPRRTWKVAWDPDYAFLLGK